MADDRPSLGAFGATFRGLFEQMASQAAETEPPLAKRLREHFGAAATEFPVLEEKFKWSDRPNLQVAIDAYLAVPSRSSELIGISAGQSRFMMGIQLADLLAPPPSALMGPPPSIGPVQYLNVSLHDAEILACVQCGLYLISEGDRAFAAMVGGGRSLGLGGKELKIEVIARTREEAERFLTDIRTLMRRKNVYRGHIISLGVSEDRTLEVEFHRLPAINREGIILPVGVLDRIERHTIRFSEYRDKLRAAGRHLKRGLLLHGQPGTGKTLTAMYLAGQMKDRTALLVTGRGQSLIESTCAMARWLEPSTVIIEDVDLIAEERTRQTQGCNALLFELLNQMDGLADDADVLFILTTNRPEILEPALASRPGRIDQAIEIPLPDSTCRRRLLDLYGQGLSLLLTRLDSIVERTEGVSAAFIRELLRKSSVLAVDEGGEVLVEDRHIDEAMRELIIDGGVLTKSLLGAQHITGPAESAAGLV
jgi:hypothetical protein